MGKKGNTRSLSNNAKRWEIMSKLRHQYWGRIQKLFWIAHEKPQHLRHSFLTAEKRVATKRCFGVKRSARPHFGKYLLCLALNSRAESVSLGSVPKESPA